MFLRLPFFRQIFCALFIALIGLIGLVQPAKAETQIFLDQLQTCNLGQPYASPATTGIGFVNMFYPYAAPATEYGQIACGGTWTFDGASYVVTPNGATVFPGGASKAAWLNEAFFDSGLGTNRAKGEMRRNLTGLTVGQMYRVSADAWHDDSAGDTALGLDFGPVTATLNIPNDNVARSISAMVCAKSSSLAIRLYEAGITGASPVVTNIKLEDMGQSCLLTVDFVSNGGSAVAPQSVFPDDLATNPSVPTRPGYSFTGWFQDVGLAQPYDFATPVTQNITLYAGWAANPYHVSGTVVGLDSGNTLTLINSNGDQVQITASGPFNFPQGLLGSDNYAVTIPSQPATQTCSVTQAQSGPMNNADVTNVVVTCSAKPANAYYVSGTVVGLDSGNTLTLINSNGDQVQITASGAFNFTQSLLGSDSYAVTIPSQPATQTCSVTQAQSGPMNNADVTNVVVTCTATPAPSPTAVPSLDQWALMGLSSLLGLLALVRIRRRSC